MLVRIALTAALLASSGCDTLGYREKDPYASSAPGLGPTVRVGSVVDGDTIRVMLEGRETPVRLIGIDTPELGGSKGRGECLGRAAERFTSSEMTGRRVTLELDVDSLDPYERTLAYVWKDGRLFNETLVERGLAEERAYPPNIRHQERLRAAEDRARAARRGIWGRCGALP